MVINFLDPQSWIGFTKDLIIRINTLSIRNKENKLYISRHSRFEGMLKNLQLIITLYNVYTHIFIYIILMYICIHTYLHV